MPRGADSARCGERSRCCEGTTRAEDAQVHLLKVIYHPVYECASGAFVESLETRFTVAIEWASPPPSGGVPRSLYVMCFILKDF